jgi:hypothetical protein
VSAGGRSLSFSLQTSRFIVFGGKVTVFGGKASTFAGKASAFGAKVSAFDEKVSAFAAEVSAFDGKVSAFAGKVSAFDGKVSAFGEQILNKKNKNTVFFLLRPKREAICFPVRSVLFISHPPGTSILAFISDSVLT